MGWDFPGMLWTLVTLSVLFHVVVWLFPVVSACVVQVVLTEVIRLSGAMADDDEGGDFGEAELGTGLGWEGVRRRVAMHHQQRSRQEGEEEGLQLQHEQNEQYQRGTKKMERRVTVEWESGQMFMVIRRPIVAEWVIDLVNRYMHGPIPMKIEVCRAEMLRASLSPAQILRTGSFQATIVGLRAFARRTHEDEWDEERYYEKAIMFRRCAADYVQALIEGTFGRKLMWWGFIVDSLINNITFETRDVHLRIDDRWYGHCFGLCLDAFDCKPGVAEPESLGATPHEFAMTGLVFYIDPHNEVALSPQCPGLTVDEGTMRLEFPNIFRTLILNSEIMPGGTGKRLRVRADFSGLVTNVQANQMRTFLFSLLGTFCPYKYSAWKATVRAQVAADCRPVSAAQRWQYRKKFGTRKEERKLSASQKKGRLATLAELERHMSYRDILLLRKESRGWRLEDMGDEPPENPPLDLEFMAGIEEGNPQYEELVQFAARIQGLQVSAWEKGTCVREIMVENVVVHQAEFRLYTKADKSRDGAEDRAFKTPLQAVLLTSRGEACFRMFLSRTKASNRLHSRGANGIDGEPALPWLMAGGSLQHPVLLDEATATRLGYGSTCILAPARAVFSAGEGNGVPVREVPAGEGGRDADLTIPTLGGTFRMWSDYRMSIEGQVDEIQVGMLLSPVLELARMIADSFRRRWASGGQYPELVLARVRLAERTGAGRDRRGSLSPKGVGRQDSSRSASSPSHALMTTEATGGVASRLSLRSEGAGAAKRRQEATLEILSTMERQRELRAASVPRDGKSDAIEVEGQQGNQGAALSGLRHALPRLDGLDSSKLVERALEGLHEEDNRSRVSSSLEARDVDEMISMGAERKGNFMVARSDRLAGVGEEALDVASSLGFSNVGAIGDPGSLSATLSSANDVHGLTAVPVSAEAADEETIQGASLVGEEDDSSAEDLAQDSPTTEKFMLPGWHYLFLSGRPISIDLRWSCLDLVLMQDPTALQGRDSGKNILALRSSGELSLQSTNVGESVNANLKGVSLLPCFYTERNGEKNQEETIETDVARRLALLLGGGQRASAFVARTWLGQGLLSSDSSPLLEPFTVQAEYGTVVAQAARGGRRTGITDGRRRASQVTGAGLGRSGEGHVEGGGAEQEIPAEPEEEEEKEADWGQIERAHQHRSGEMVGGIFRVAVSGLQFLAGEPRLKGSTTVEVEVNGRTRSFQAARVLTIAGDSVELEFACHCRLRRRRGRRRLASISSTDAVTSTAAFDRTPSRRSTSMEAAISGGDQQDEPGYPAEGTSDGEVEEGREAEPEVAAKVRLRAPGGKLLGEAWAELPGAPDNWARYPLYSPGAVGKNRAEAGSWTDTGDPANGEVPATSQVTGLERREFIPAAPATVRRRWGWGISAGGAGANSAPTGRSRLWSHPRKPRDVAGEVKLRLTWIPSGLSVTIHRRWGLDPVGSGASPTARGEEAGADGRSHTAGQRRPIVVVADPGGGAKLAYPVEAQARVGGLLSAAPVEIESCGELSVARDEDILSSRGKRDADEVVPDTGESSPESLFYALDPVCLLGGVDVASAAVNMSDTDMGSGGARLLLLTPVGSEGVDGLSAEGAAEALQEIAVGASKKEGEGSDSLVASTELLLFPGANPARRWVTLTDTAGNARVEVDITVAWVLAPPDPFPPSGTEGRGSTTEVNQVVPTGGSATATVTPSICDGLDVPEGQVAPSTGSDILGAGTASRQAKDLQAGNKGNKGVVDGDRQNVSETRRASASADGGEEEDIPEPAQVVSRRFCVEASDLVMRVSDLDVAVLVTMTKSIVQIFKPPKSMEERELELEAVQQRLLEEANSKRNAAIQQLRETFRKTPSRDETAPSPQDEKSEELLSVRDVVELLRDFLRARALTESEISHEAEEFMMVVLAVADEANSRAPAHGYQQSRKVTPWGSKGNRTGSAADVSVRDDGAGTRDARPGSRARRRRGTLRSEWPDGGKHPPTRASQGLTHDGVEGFICPQCHKKLASPAALLAHFHVFHEGSDARDNEDGSKRESGGSSDSGGNDNPYGSYSPWSRKGGGSRGSWRGTSISLDHFILALQSFMEEQAHEGYVMARCEEFASDEIERVILDGFPSLSHRLSVISPTHPLPEFWEVMKKEVGATKSSAGGQHVRVFQTRMVRALKNYAVARSAWAHLIVPALFSVPRCGAIKAASGRTYLPMPCPVREGQPFYVDKPSIVITHLPPALVGGAESEEGIASLAVSATPAAAADAVVASNTGGAEGRTADKTAVLLTGIMTHSKDRDLSGIRAFLTFSLDKPAVVYVCYDQRLKRRPVWLLYFEKTSWVVRTTEGNFGVWRKRYPRGQVRLGCNEGWRKGCANYFLLIGSDYPKDNRALGSQIPTFKRTHSSSDLSSHSTPLQAPQLPAPPSAPWPRGLLPDGDSSEADKASIACWVLRPQALAGGRGSLSQAVRALVDERRRSRAQSRSQLLPGGNTRSQLDAAAATAAELGLELAPVELQYEAFFNVGSMSLRVVDPVAAHVKAESRLSHASGRLVLRHLHPGDWLGRPDSLVFRASLGGFGKYYNPLVDEREYFVEPWRGSVECRSDMGEPTTELRVDVPEHAVVNVTSALVENIKTIATLVARNWSERYTEPPVGKATASGGGGTLLIRNTLGVDVFIRRVEDQNWGAVDEDRDWDNGLFLGDDDDEVGFIDETCFHDTLHEKTVPAGQAVEYRLPAKTRSGEEAALEFAVHVPGFRAVSGVELRSRGAFAYPLIQVVAPSSRRAPTVTRLSAGVSGGARGVAERNVGVKNPPVQSGLALVVDVREKNAAAAAVAAADVAIHTADRRGPNSSASFVGGLVAELRTNVSLHNTSASEVEVDMGDSMAAEAAAAGTVGVSKTLRLGSLRPDWVPRGGNTPVVRLAPGARLALPLSVLKSWHLRIVGDATDARTRPLRLSPALLDPTVPNALRFTSDMEQNSVCLRPAKSSVKSAGKKVAAQVTTAGMSASIGAMRGGVGVSSGNSSVPYAASVKSNASGAAGLSTLSEAALSPEPSPPRLSLRTGGSRRSRRIEFRTHDTPQSISVERRDREGSIETVASGAKPPIGLGSKSASPVRTGRRTAAPVAAADWVLVVQPSLVFTNALPCAMEVELLQPSPLVGVAAPAVAPERSVTGESIGSDMDSLDLSTAGSQVGRVEGASRGTRAPRKAAPRRNPARDLFFLPKADSMSLMSPTDHNVGGIARTSDERSVINADDRKRSSLPNNGGRVREPQSDLERDGDARGSRLESVWKGLVGSGHDAKVGRVDKSRPFYVRLRLPDPAASSGTPVTNQPLPPCYQWSDYLVINISDHAQRSLFNLRQPEDITWHRAAREDWGRPVTMASGRQETGKSRRQPWPELKAARSWGRSSARRVTFYAPYWIVNKTGLALNYRARYPQRSTFSMLSTSTSSRNQAAGNALGSFGGIANLNTSHRGLVGTGETPSASAGIAEQCTPIPSADEPAHAQVARLLLREATYVGDEEHLDFFGGRSIPVMLGCPDQTLEVMPYAVAARAEEVGLCVCDLQVDSDYFPSQYYCVTNPTAGTPLYTDCAVCVEAFPEAIAGAATQPGSAVQILTPWRESPAPDKEAFMTFWLTRDALVHVCMDSRTPTRKLPSWLEYAGFRKMPGVEVSTSEPGLSLQVFRRFFRARTLVKIGGSDNSRDVAHALIELSGGSMTPDGPAPKGMLANYTVVLTTVIPPVCRPPPPFEGLQREGRVGGPWGPVVSAYVEEADVRDALVDRDMTESIMCRKRYRILPDFAPGDRPYVDRDYTIPSLPPELQSTRLTCIQTAQGDKRARGSRLWRFSLMQDSVVFVIFDARAVSVPQWLATAGFVLWEGVEIKGAEYKIPYSYKVYRKQCSTGLVWLGGNGARGSKGAKRGYFVLVHVANRPIHEARLPASPSPLSPPTPQPGVSSSGGGSNVFRGQVAIPSLVRRDSEPNALSSAQSCSSTFISDPFAEGMGTGDDDGIDSVASMTSRSPVEHPLAVTRRSPSSRSFGSLDVLAGSRGYGVGDSGGGDSRGGNRKEGLAVAVEQKGAGDERTGGVFGQRRRGMSATDTSFDPASKAMQKMESASIHGRERAWTGDEETGLGSPRVHKPGAGKPGTTKGGSSRSGKGLGKSGSSAGNLQRISAVWNTERNGAVSQIPVPFDRVGRRWSRKFNVDAANTGGPLETSGATLGVSVSALTGQFHRTRVVTLYPRLIVRNFLGFPLEVMPTVISPKASSVNRLGQCIPPPMPAPDGDPFPRAPRHQDLGVDMTAPASAGGRGGSGNVGSRRSMPSAAFNSGAGGGTEHLVQTVPTSAAVIVYAFNSASRLIKGLAATRGTSVDSASSAAVEGDADDRRKCILIRASAGDRADGDGGGSGGGYVHGAGERSRSDRSGSGFGEALAQGLSRPILAEDMGETHLWVVDSLGRRYLAAAFVSLQRATIFLTISASGQFPPFRIENRSSAETLAYRQVDAHKTMGWHVLPPLSWHAFLWQEPDKPRAIEVAFSGAATRSNYNARHSQEYSMDKIGDREPLEGDSITRTMLALVATGTRSKRLFSEVRVEGRTRVLSFGDVPLLDGHAHGAHADSLTRFKRLYSQLDVGVRFAGVSFNIVECTSEGPSEVTSAHVDSLTVAKRSGGNLVEVQIFHVQVDDMRRRTRMPVVLQPTNSGFNSHLRGGGSENVVIQGRAGVATPVPFLRILYESEVATMSMPHLKSLDVDLQEMRTHIDLEFVLHVLGLAGTLVPELTSEEVLARMCRNKAKVAVRHTVPTPAKRDLSMVYVECFRHSPIVVRVELLVGPGALSPDAMALEDPEATTGGLTVLGGSSLTILSVLGSSLAHVSPTFVFDELVVTHYCGSLRGLTGLVQTALTQQAVAQGYKVLGSMELLGDPLSLVSKFGESVVQFFHKTKAEMTGDANTMGAGAKVLVKGLVGGTFGSAAKITGSLEEMIRGLSGTEIFKEDEREMGDGERQGEVKGLEHGVKEGGKVFYESMKAGLSGLIDRPKEGAKEEGFAGFIAGMAKGIVGAVAAPVAGALGAVARVTEGVDASTRSSDEKSMGRRRAARTPRTSVTSGGALAPLTPKDLVKHVPRKFAALWVDTASGHPSATHSSREPHLGVTGPGVAEGGDDKAESAPGEAGQG